MTDSLEQQFHQRMQDLYWDAGRAVGYWASRYLQKVRRVGGLQAARDWLRRDAGPAAGLEKLIEANRLDLSVEALVLQEPWRQLFSQEELEVAQRRLNEAGGYIRGDSANPGSTYEPYRLRDPQERERRRANLALPHVAPLTALVEDIRRRERLNEDVPYLDPDDGGVNARVLFLLKAPGPGAVESGFVSHSNPDQSARNFSELLEEAGIPREETVTWNLVPWALRDRSGNVRPVSAADEEDAQPYLQRLFTLLPKVQVVVLMGQSAREARKTVVKLTRARIIETHLTSAQVINSDPAQRAKILADLKRVAAHLGGLEAGNTSRPV